MSAGLSAGSAVAQRRRGGAAELEQRRAAARASRSRWSSRTWAMIAHLSAGGIGQRYAGISPIPFVMTSKICPIQVLQDLLLVERGSGNVASLEQDPPAVPRASWQGWQ